MPFGMLLGAGAQFGLNYLQGKIGNDWAKDQIKFSAETNAELNEKAAQNAYARQKALIEQYQTPQALMKMYKEAGLSTSLMAGGAGGAPAGMAGAQGAGAAGPTASTFGMAQQELLNAANIRLINAQADQIEGKNTRGKAEIEKILAESGNTKAQQLWTESKTIYQNLQNRITQATTQDQIELISKEVEQAGWKAIQAQWEAKQTEQDYKFNQKTFNIRVENEFTKYDLQLQEYLNKIAEGELTKEQTAKTIAETKAIGKQIAIAYEQNRIYEKSVDVQKKWFDDQIKQRKEQFDKQLDWEGEKFTQEVKQRKKEMWVRFAGGVVGSAIGGASIMAAGPIKAAVAAGKAVIPTEPQPNIYHETKN